MLFVLAVRPRRTVGIIVVLAVMALLPLSAYGEQVIRLTRSAAPMRSTRDCLLDVESREPNARGLYVSVPHDVLPHDVYYYFRRVRPWLPAAADLASVAKLLDDPTSVRPTLIAGFKARVAGRLRDRDETAAERKLATLAAVDFGDVTLLLPEPYGRCAAAAAAASGRSLYNNRLALAGAR
jgi:hypothetical protein